MDPFATLGIDPPRYDVDLVALEKTHRELSRALHPDRYVGSGASERRAALARAVEVNEAWRIVRDPIRRAEALLASQGVKTGEERQGPVDPEFLMEMMEQREALAEAKQARDLPAVRRMGASAAASAKAIEGELAEGFRTGRAPSLVATLAKLKYHRRFLDEVASIEDEASSSS